MKPTMVHNRHLADDELLLLAEGELASRKAAWARAHLSECRECNGRMAETTDRLAAIAAAYRSGRPAGEDHAGTRALLKARLAEEAEGASTAREHSFGLGFHLGNLHLRNLYTRGLSFSTLAYAGALVVLVVLGFQVANQAGWRGRFAGVGPLPDPRFTPGSTRQASLSDLCAVERDDVVRSVPGPVEQQVFQEYGIRRVASEDFEVDYLITPGLGGSDDVKNLWPEPHSHTVWNSYVKDQLEDRLHRMVCERKIPLEQAQRDIAGNWIVAYKKYFQTDQPVAATRSVSASEMASLR